MHRSGSTLIGRARWCALSAGAAALLIAGSAGAQVVLDESTNAVLHPGLLNGGVELDTTDAAVGTGSLRRLDGGDATDRMDIGGDPASLAATNGLSFMAWVKVVTLNGSQGVVRIGSCCDPRNGYILELNGDGTVRFWGSSNDDISRNLNSATAVNDGAWHHIGLRDNGVDTMELLIDGVVENTLVVTIIPSDPSQAGADSERSDLFPSVAGEGVDPGNYGSEILVDEVRVYDSFLDDTAWGMAQGGSGPPPDLLYYDFEPLNCRTSEKSLLNITAKKGKMKWKWDRGAATTKAEFGDPTASTGYTFCIVDQGGERAECNSVAPGASWKDKKKGFDFKQKTGAIQQIKLKEGSDGKAKIQVQGTSELMLPLVQSPSVSAVLLSDDGVCWQTDFTTSRKNDTKKFSAK